MKYSTNPYRGRKKEERTRELGKRNAALPSTGEKIERLCLERHASILLLVMQYTVHTVMVICMLSTIFAQIFSIQ